MGFEDDLEISDLDSRFNSMQLPSPSSSLILQETTVPQSECLNLGHGIHNNNALMDDEDDEDDFDFKDSKNNLFFNNSTANTGNTINTSNTVSAADAAASTIKVTTANDVNGDDDDGLFDDLEISLDDVRFNNHTLSGGEVLDAENEDVQVIDLEDTLPEDEEKDKVEKSQTFDGNVGKVVEIVESQQQEQNSTLVLSPTLNPPTPKQASPLVDKSSHVINTIKHLSNNLRRNSTSTNTIATNSKNPSFPFSKSLNTSPIRSSTAFSVSSSPSSSSSAPMWLPFTKGSSLSTSSSKSGSTSATTYNPSRRSQSASFASAVHLQNMSSQWMASLGGGGGGRSLSSSPTKRSNSNSASSSLTTSSSSSVTNPLQSSTSTNPSSLVLRRPQGISRNGSDFCSGNELDGMDDLVVETEKEKRFLVKPKQQQQRKQQKQQQQKESLKGLTKQKIVANNNVKNSISNPSSTASRKSGTTTSTTTGVVGTWSGVKKTSTNALSTSPSSSSPRPPLAKSPMTVNRSTHPAPILNHHHRQYFPHHNHHHYLQQQQQFSKPPLSSSSSSPMALLNRSTSIPSRKTTSTSLSSTTPTSRIPSPRLKKNSAPPVSVATTAQPTLIRNLNKHTKRTRGKRG